MKENDKVLILESCTHHNIEDDIARVKIPKLLQNKLAYKYHPGDSFENYFQENRALVFKKDGEICIIPDSLNTIGGTDDHSIKVISKINSENDNALNAEIVSTAAKIFLNQAASSIPVDAKSTFLKIAQLIDNNPPAKEKC